MPEPSLSAFFPSLPSTTRGSALIVGCSPDGSKILYCNGNFIYTVPIHDLKSAEIYTEHKAPTTAAKISPNGNYCASADVQGNLRVWDVTQPSHIVKMKARPLTGSIKDIAWCGESRRVVVAGDGSTSFAQVFLIDGGTSNGNLGGVSARLNTVDFNPGRPLRILAGGDSMELSVFEGVPFKLKKTIGLRGLHTNYINVVRYSPDGLKFASGGSDRRLVLCDAKTNEKIGNFEEFNGFSHNGSVYGIAWSPDSSKIASASADKTVIIWDVATRSVLQNITFSPTEVEDQQMAIVWTEKALVSVSLSGALNILDPENGRILSVRNGHNKGITRLAKSFDGKELYSADAGGRVVTWDVSTGTSTSATLHSSIITGMSCSVLGELITVGWDDKLVITSPETPAKSFKLSAQPNGLAVSTDGSVAVAACLKIVSILTDFSQLTDIKLEFESTCVALSPDSKVIAIGDKKEHVYIYQWDGVKMANEVRLDVVGIATSISFSADGEFMVVTTSSGKVIPFHASNNFNLINPAIWSSHRGKALCSAWSPDSKRFATSSLDRTIIVWDMRKPTDEPIKIQNCHPSEVNALVWIDESTLASAGQDSNIKLWNVPV